MWAANALSSSSPATAIPLAARIVSSGDPGLGKISSTATSSVPPPRSKINALFFSVIVSPLENRDHHQAILADIGSSIT